MSDPELKPDPEMVEISKLYGELLYGCVDDLGVTERQAAAIIARTTKFLMDADERADA